MRREPNSRGSQSATELIGCLVVKKPLDDEDPTELDKLRDAGAENVRMRLVEQLCA